MATVTRHFQLSQAPSPAHISVLNSRLGYLPASTACSLMSSHLRLNMPRTHLPSETGVNTYPSPSQCMATASFSSLRPMIFGSILTHNLSLKSSIYSIRQSCGTYLQNRSKTNHCSLSGLETSWSGPPSSLPWIPAEANRSPCSFPHPAPTPPPPNASQHLQRHQDTPEKGKPFNGEAPVGTPRSLATTLLLASRLSLSIMQGMSCPKGPLR